MSDPKALRTLAPGLLLAAPRLGDPNFERSVVLLARHGADGALGWVLNGKAIGRVSELLQRSETLREAGITAADARGPGFDSTARKGGPVQQGSGWIIYRREVGVEPLPGELDVGEALAVSNDLSAFGRLVGGAGPRDFRLVLGYAGWGPGQLEDEVREGSWLPAPVDPSLLWECSPEALWDEAYRRCIGAAPGAFMTARRGSA